MTKAVKPLSIRPPLAPISFAIGMIAALPEFAGGSAFRRLRPIATRLMDMASVRGRCLDGYDFVADRAMLRGMRKRGQGK